MVRTLCQRRAFHSGCVGRQLLRAALLLALIPIFATKSSRIFHPRGLFGLELRPSTQGHLTSFSGSSAHGESTFGRPVNASIRYTSDGDSDHDGDQNQTSLDAKPQVSLMPPRIERKLSFTRDLFSVSIEDLGSLLSDPMGLFQKRKVKLARAGSEMAQTIHLGNHSNNATAAAVADVEQRPLLTIAEREALVRKWGFAFELAEAEAVSIFERLRTSSSGLLSKSEFMAALRLLGVEKTKRKSASTFFRGKHSYNRLLEFMFNAIDLDNVGAVSCYAFLDWLLTMTSGNPEARLRWGFNVCDTDGDGWADKVEITALLTSMFSVLTGLRLDHQNPYVDIFVSSLFQRRAGGTAEADPRPGLLSWEDYKRGCLGSADVMALVHSPDQPYRKGYFGGTHLSKSNKKVLRSGGLALRLGKAMVMSQKKCDFILAMMLGLQVAVERPVARASTPPLEVEKGEEEVHHFLHALKGFFLGIFAGDSHPDPHPQLPLADGGGGGEAAAAAAYGEHGGGGEQEGGDGGGKGEAGLMEGGRKWWKPFGAKRRSLRPDIQVQTYRLPSVLRWSEQEEEEEAGGGGCFGGLAWAGAGCLGGRGASPDDTPSAITAYGANLYRQIRTVFGVSDDTFLASLGIKQVLGGLLMGDMRGMAEQVSEGRSGSLFYYSHDGKFMVKTVSSAESKAMLNMLPDYCAYILKNPDTLLMRILGQFDLLHCGRKYHLVVLANVFNTSLAIHERFDLKGSTFGRTLGPQRGIPGLVHRDLDFTETGRQLRVSPELAELLRRQIRSDAAFLEQQNVLDYSLLIGVHRRKKASDASEQGPLYPRAPGMGQYGGMGGREPQHVAAAQTWAAQNSKSLQVLFDTLRAGLEDHHKRGTVSAEVMDSLVFSKFAEFAHKCSSKGSVGGPEAPSPKEQSPQKKSKAGGSSVGALGERNGTGINVFQHQMGGMYGSSRAEAEGSEEEVLFVGIIDTLVPFKVKKKAEFWIKSNLLQRGKNFSVIPPADYAKRFVNFCTSIVHSFPT